MPDAFRHTQIHWIVGTLQSWPFQGEWLQCEFQSNGPVVKQALIDGSSPMGSNQIDTQSAVIQILPLARPGTAVKQRAGRQFAVTLANQQ